MKITACIIEKLVSYIVDKDNLDTKRFSVLYCT